MPKTFRNTGATQLTYVVPGVRELNVVPPGASFTLPDEHAGLVGGAIPADQVEALPEAVPAPIDQPDPEPAPPAEPQAAEPAPDVEASKAPTKAKAK